MLSSTDERYSPGETERRMTDTIRRALNTPAKLEKETVMRKGGSTIPEKYRGVEYWVAKQAESAWTWQLHPKMEHGGRPVTSGIARGMNQNAAVEAAYRAIGKMLNTKK